MPAEVVRGIAVICSCVALTISIFAFRGWLVFSFVVHELLLILCNNRDYSTVANHTWQIVRTVARANFKWQLESNNNYIYTSKVYDAWVFSLIDLAPGPYSYTVICMFGISPRLSASGIPSYTPNRTTDLNAPSANDYGSGISLHRSW